MHPRQPTSASAPRRRTWNRSSPPHDGHGPTSSPERTRNPSVSARSDQSAQLGNGALVIGPPRAAPPPLAGFLLAPGATRRTAGTSRGANAPERRTNGTGRSGGLPRSRSRALMYHSSSHGSPAVVRVDGCGVEPHGSGSQHPPGTVAPPTETTRAPITPGAHSLPGQAAGRCAPASDSTAPRDSSAGKREFSHRSTSSERQPTARSPNRA